MTYITHFKISVRGRDGVKGSGNIFIGCRYRKAVTGVLSPVDRFLLTLWSPSVCNGVTESEGISRFRLTDHTVKV